MDFLILIFCFVLITIVKHTRQFIQKCYHSRLNIDLHGYPENRSMKLILIKVSTSNEQIFRRRLIILTTFVIYFFLSLGQSDSRSVTVPNINPPLKLNFSNVSKHVLPSSVSINSKKDYSCGTKNRNSPKSTNQRCHIPKDNSKPISQKNNLITEFNKNLQIVRIIRVIIYSV